jgi:hypothetical protein
MVFMVLIDEVKEVGDLIVFLIRLADGRDNDDMAVIIAFDDGFDLPPFLGGGEGGTAEFAYFIPYLASSMIFLTIWTAFAAAPFLTLSATE